MWCLCHLFNIKRWIGKCSQKWIGKCSLFLYFLKNVIFRLLNRIHEWNYLCLEGLFVCMCVEEVLWLQIQFYWEGYSDFLFHFMSVLNCNLQGKCIFHVCCQIFGIKYFIIFSDYSFNICGTFNDNLFIISNIGNLSSPSFFSWQI